MKVALQQRKLALIESLAAISNPELLEQLLPQLEDILAPHLRAKLSDKAYEDVLIGLYDYEAGRLHSKEEGMRVIAEAIEKAKASSKKNSKRHAQAA